MRILSLDDFSGRLGATYDIVFPDAALPMSLAVAEVLPDSGREGGSFRLEFAGPVDPVLPQGIYPFRSDVETVEIFVTPISRDQNGTRYEAIFF